MGRLVLPLRRCHKPPIPPRPSPLPLPTLPRRADGLVWAVLNLFFHGLALFQVGALASSHLPQRACLCIWRQRRSIAEAGRCLTAALPLPLRAVPQLIWDERRIRFASEEQEQVWRFFNRRSGMGRLEMQQVRRGLSSAAADAAGPSVGCRQLNLGAASKG